MEVYADDMIVKSLLAESHVDDLRECFQNLRKKNMNLNPSKCTFGLNAGMFLDHLVSQRGIVANPKKIIVILDMQPPRTYKEIQRLTGRLAALQRFLSKLAERCLSFFDTFKSSKDSKLVQWTPACQTAFEEIKPHLVTPPILSKALPKITVHIRSFPFFLSLDKLHAAGKVGRGGNSDGKEGERIGRGEGGRGGGEEEKKATADGAQRRQRRGEKGRVPCGTYTEVYRYTKEG